MDELNADEASSLAEQLAETAFGAYDAHLAAGDETGAR